jgi:hypothetical protein
MDCVPSSVASCVAVTVAVEAIASAALAAAVVDVGETTVGSFTTLDGVICAEACAAIAQSICDPLLGGLAIVFHC